MQELKVTSAAFEEGEMIPKRYTCDGKDINPPITIKGVPEEAETLLLIVDDPDAPMGTWTHWVVWNIPAEPEVFIPEDTIPGIRGENDFDRVGYGGPCPPDGIHRYFFRAYAVSKQIPFPEGKPRQDIEEWMRDYLVAKGELMGKYKKRL